MTGFKHPTLRVTPLHQMFRSCRTVHNDLALTFGNDADGNRSRISYPSGSVALYTFDFAGRPLSLTAGGTSFVTSARICHSVP